LCVDHPIGSLSEIWQDNYLSVYAKVASQPLKASGSQESISRVWHTAIQCRVKNSPPLSPLPLSKRPRSSPWHLLSVLPLPTVFLGNPVSLHSKVSCKNLSVVRAHLELWFRPPCVILRPSIKSYQRSRAHPRHPRKKLHPRNPPRMTNQSRQDRSLHRHFSIPPRFSDFHRSSFSRNLDAWSDSATPPHDVVACSFYDVKAFKCVRLVNSYHLE